MGKVALRGMFFLQYDRERGVAGSRRSEGETERRGVGVSTTNALVTEPRARVERRGARSCVPGVREYQRGGGRPRSAVHTTARPEPEAAHRGRQVADTASEVFERDGRAAAAARVALRAGAWGREAPLTAARTADMVSSARPRRGANRRETPSDEAVT